MRWRMMNALVVMVVRESVVGNANTRPAVGRRVGEVVMPERDERADLLSGGSCWEGSGGENVAVSAPGCRPEGSCRWVLHGHHPSLHSVSESCASDSFARAVLFADCLLYRTLGVRAVSRERERDRERQRERGVGRERGEKGGREGRNGWRTELHEKVVCSFSSVASCLATLRLTDKLYY